jgi:hypothetical protein
MGEEVPRQGADADAPEGVEAPEAAEVAAPAQRRRESRRLLRAEVYYAAGLATFAVLAVLAHAYAYFAWDLRLAHALQSVDFPGWGEFMSFVSVFGNRWHPHALATATAIVFFVWRRRSECFALALSAAAARRPRRRGSRSSRRRT